MKVLNLLPLLAVASCLPIYANIRVVKVNNDGVASIKDYKNVNLDGIDSLDQLAASPDFKRPHEIAPKHKKPHHRISGVKPCHGGPKPGLKSKGVHKSGHKNKEHHKKPESVVAGPFKSYEEIKEFTDHLVSGSSEGGHAVENNYLESTKAWATDLVQDVKDIDFKESFKNIASDNDALLAVGAGFLSGILLYCIIYLVYLRKLSFDQKFEDYEAQPVILQSESSEYKDEKLPLYQDEVSDDEE